MKTITPILIFVISWIFSGCEKAIQPDGSLPNIVWSVDTVQIQQPILPVNLRIRASSDGRAYIVGHNDVDFGVLLTIDGTSWKNVDQLPSNFVPSDMLLLANNEALIVGYTTAGNAAAYRLTSGVWTSMVLTAYGGKLTSIGGSLEHSIWAGGLGKTLYLLNGNVWSLVDYGSATNDIVHDSVYHRVHVIIEMTGSQPALLVWDREFWQNYGEMIESNVFTLDASGTIWRYAYGIIGMNSHFPSIWVRNDTSIFAAMDYGLFEINPLKSMKEVRLLQDIYGVFGSSPNDIFAVGQSVVFQFDGTNWLTHAFFSNTSLTYTSVWTDGPTILICGYINSSPPRIVVSRGKRLSWAR